MSMRQAEESFTLELPEIFSVVPIDQLWQIKHTCKASFNVDLPLMKRPSPNPTE